MKPGRIVLGVGLVVLAVAAFAVYYVVTSLDGMVRTAIEQYGSEILGTSVRVSSVSLELTEGKGTIRGLRVANPDGFPSGDTVSFGEIALGLDVSSLGSRDPIVITLIDVAEPAVSLVMDARGKSNLQVIQENTARYASGSQGAGAPSGSEEASSEGPPTLLAIRKLVVEGGRLAADLTAVGGERSEVELPPLRLSNVGGNKGAPPGELGTTVASAFIKSTSTAVFAYDTVLASWEDRFFIHNQSINVGYADVHVRMVTALE